MPFSTSAEHRLFSTYGKLSTIDHIQSYKFQQLDTLQSSFSDHSMYNRIKLEKRNLPGNSPFIWELSNTYLSNSWVKKEFSGKIIKCFNLSKNKTQHIKICGMQLEQCLKTILSAYIRKQEMFKINDPLS